MLYLSRTDWGAAPAKKTLPVSRHLKGVCIHWMGFPIHDDPATITSSIQRAHMSPPRSWWDIAYNELIGLDGTVVEGRGLLHRSGAQGGTRNNKDYVALGLLLGPGQLPTADMVAAVQQRIALVRYFQPQATAIVGHQQLKPTQCPGPDVMALLRAGAFEPGGVRSVAGAASRTTEEHPTATFAGRAQQADDRIDGLSVDRLEDRDRLVEKRLGELLHAAYLPPWVPDGVRLPVHARGRRGHCSAGQPDDGQVPQSDLGVGPGQDEFEVDVGGRWPVHLLRRPATRGGQVSIRQHRTLR